MRLPSAHQHNFAVQPSINIPRSAFQRNHSHSFTFNAGYLVPFFHDADILPGDTMKLKASIFARLNTPYFPIMTNVYMMVHFWAVPNRLVWEHWVNFMGETALPWTTDPTPTVYITPISVIPAGGFAPGSLQNCFGLPPTDGTITCEGAEYNTFLFRGYNYTWNFAYRDQNLQDPVVVDTGDGPDDPADYVLLKRGKRHDYFTSCLPFAQKGDPVGISLGGTLPVELTTTMGVSPIIRRANDHVAVNTTANAALGASQDTPTFPTGTFRIDAASGTISNTTAAVFDPNGTLVADASAATALTINAFRSAFLAQEILERDARGGTRYPEQIYAAFGVTNPDSRMQYPEYLGGSTVPLDITSVPQTSASESGSPQANLAAFGTFSGRNIGFTKSFTEHSMVFGLLCVYADLTYAQGLPRHFSRRTRLDYYDPILANLGEQAVLNQEIYCQGTVGGPNDADTFGYQERWAEYRYMPNRVSGLFAPQVVGTLAAWNLCQDFGSLPQLSSEFIEEDPPFDRVIVVDSEPDFKADTYIDLVHVRAMPVRSIPVKLGGRRMW